MLGHHTLNAYSRIVWLIRKLLNYPLTFQTHTHTQHQLYPAQHATNSLENSSLIMSHLYLATNFTRTDLNIVVQGGLYGPPS